MIGIIVTGHGNFASGLLSAAKVVAGDAENVREVDFTETSGTEKLKRDLSKTMEELSEKCRGGILVLSDLTGGSPYNESVMLNHAHTAVVSGANFPMLLSCIFERDGASLEELCAKAVEGGREGIGMFSASWGAKAAMNGPEEDEDGI